MTDYTVSVSPQVAEAIAEYGYYIANQSGSPVIAERWMARVYATIAKLHYSPHRFVTAEEDSHREYEIRRQIIGKYLALYTVDEEQKRVMVIGFRHGHRLPRPDDLPNAL